MHCSIDLIVNFVTISQSYDQNAKNIDETVVQDVKMPAMND